MRRSTDMSDTSLYIDDPIREIARAVVRRAAEDVKDRNLHPNIRASIAKWLTGPDAEIWCAAGNVRIDTVKEWGEHYWQKLHSHN